MAGLFRIVRPCRPLLPASHLLVVYGSSIGTPQGVHPARARLREQPHALGPLPCKQPVATFPTCRCPMVCEVRCCEAGDPLPKKCGSSCMHSCCSRFILAGRSLASGGGLMRTKASLLVAAVAALVVALVFLSEGDRVPLPSPSSSPNASPRESGGDAGSLARVAATSSSSEPGHAVAEQERLFLSGVVLDEKAAPIAGATVMQEAPHDNAAKTDERGWFRLPRSFRPGEAVLLRTICRGFLAATNSVPAVSSREEVVRMQRAPRVSGSVFDQRGMPVSGYTLKAHDANRRQLALATTTADGRFELIAGEAVTDKSVTITEVFVNGHGLLAQPAVAEWGDEGLGLVTLDPGHVTIRVRESGSLLPVARYSLSLHHHEHQGPQGWKRESPLQVDNVEGIAQVACLPGAVSFAVIPAEPSLEPSAVRQCRIESGLSQQIDVLLEKARVLEITTVDQAGLAVAGVKLQLVAAAGGTGSVGDATVPLLSQDDGSKALQWSHVGVVERALSAADGHAAIRMRSGLGRDLRVEWQCPGYCAGSAPIALEAIGNELRIELLRVTRLRGSVVPASVLQFSPSVRGVFHRKGKPSYGEWVVVDRNSGTFELDLSPTEDMRVDLALVVGGRSVVAAKGIAMVPANTGAVLEPIELDAAGCLPGAVTGRVLVDGVAPLKVRAHPTESNGNAAPGFVAEAVVGPDGSYALEPMLAGTWFLSAVLPSDTGTTSPQLPLLFGSAIVSSAGRTVVDGRLDTVDCELLVKDEAGVAMAGRRAIVALVRCPSRPVAVPLDAAGVLRLRAPSAAETIEVRCTGGSGEILLGSCPVTAKELVLSSADRAGK